MGVKYINNHYDRIKNSDEEEIVLSKSTDKYRFDVSSPAEEEKNSAEIDLDPKAQKEVASFIKGSKNKVVMFALEWCEFCWSVRKILDKYDVEFQSIDLDSVEFSEDKIGSNMRHVLEQENDWKTLPQIYIGEEFVGGCTDLFDRCISGELQKMFDKYDISYDKTVDLNPYDLLPGWLHPR